MKKILISIIVIASVAVTAIGATRAFFSDTETSTNNLFQAGKIDLSLNGNNGSAQALINIEDLKPGDPINIPKTLFVDSNNAYIWMHIKDVVTGQGDQTEPEDEEENGTPKFDINNYLTYGLTGVENQDVIDPQSQIDFNDAVSCWIPLGVISGGQNVDIHQHFYFDENVTNWAQGDTMTFTEEFYAEQARNNPDPAGPESLTGRIWDPINHKCVDENPTSTPSPTPIACTSTFAQTASSKIQGTQKGGAAVLANRSDETASFGSPQTSGAVSDTGFPIGSFYSLGFSNGSIIFGFNSPFYDTAGVDLKVYETTGGTYPDEKIKVEVASDLLGSWTDFGIFTRDALIDLADQGITSGQYVRLTESSDINLFANDADGYDVDAIEALCGTQDLGPGF